MVRELQVIQASLVQRAKGLGERDDLETIGQGSVNSSLQVGCLVF